MTKTNNASFFLNDSSEQNCNATNAVVYEAVHLKKKTPSDLIVVQKIETQANQPRNIIYLEI